MDFSLFKISERTKVPWGKDQTGIIVPSHSFQSDLMVCWGRGRLYLVAFSPEIDRFKGVPINFLVESGYPWKYQDSRVPWIQNNVHLLRYYLLFPLIFSLMMQPMMKALSVTEFFIAKHFKTYLMMSLIKSYNWFR